MLRSAIAVTCVLLVAAILSPSTALAKGGNGLHQVAAPKASDSRKVTAHKGRAETRAVTKSKAAPRSKRTTIASSRPKAAGTHRTTAAITPKRTAKQASTAEAPAVRTSRPTKPEPDVGTADVLMYGATYRDALSQRSAPAADIETRGVLDTIRVRTLASLASIRALAAKASALVAAWFGA